MKKFTSAIVAVLLIITLVCPTYAQNEKIDNIKDLQIVADSAVLIDAKTGTILYDKDMHKKQFPASITKIMTAMLAIQKGNLDDIVTFSHNAVYGLERGSSIGMKEGEQITLRDAVYGLMLMSANECGMAIAEHIDGTVEKFCERMTDKAKELGCTETNFTNPHGLPADTHYTSALDMALIMQEALKLPQFREIIQTLRYEIPVTNLTDETRPLATQHQMINKNTEYYYEGCLGGKLGYTIIANQTLVTAAERNGMELIAVVLKDSKVGRYTDTIKLFDYGFDNFTYKQIFNKDSFLAAALVEQEDETIDSISVAASSDIYALLPKEYLEKDIKAIKNLPIKISAPVLLGDVVGDITYTYKGKNIGKVNLLSTQSVYVDEDKTTKKETKETTAPTTEPQTTEVFAPTTEETSNSAVSAEANEKRPFSEAVLPYIAGFTMLLMTGLYVLVNRK